MSTPTFAELQAEATKGPFINHIGQETIWSNDGETLVARTEYTRANMRPNEDTNNAELITRLLNWAHAGGADALTECLRLMDTGGLECGQSAKLAAKMELHAKLRFVVGVLSGDAVK